MSDTMTRGAAALSPSPGTPGEGWGEGSREVQPKDEQALTAPNPHPALSRSTGRGKYVAALAGFLALVAVGCDHKEQQSAAPAERPAAPVVVAPVITRDGPI